MWIIRSKNFCNTWENWMDQSCPSSFEFSALEIWYIWKIQRYHQLQMLFRSHTAWLVIYSQTEEYFRAVYGDRILYVQLPWHAIWFIHEKPILLSTYNIQGQYYSSSIVYDNLRDNAELVSFHDGNIWMIRLDIINADENFR